MNITLYKSIIEAFLAELRDAASNEPTSLPFIVQTIPTTPLVADNELFQILVIGGSVMKKALAKKHDGTITIVHKEEEIQPPFKTREDFLRYAEKEIADDVRVVALNFAYPLEPVFKNSRLDGKLLMGTKENTFFGMEGKEVGKEIEDCFRKKNRKLTVSTANDTVCLLLSGLTVSSPDALVGGIVGTGVNFAFFLDNNKIVNLESANFDKFPPSKEGKEIDKKSSHPGKALFEKETAGAYLYLHFNSMVEKKLIKSPLLSSTWDLKKLALSTTTNPASQAAKKLIEHSAALIACQIAGITLYNEKNMVFVMEGSFFWDKHIYKDYVKKYLNMLIPNFEITFIKIEDSTILGAAKLVS